MKTKRKNRKVVRLTESKLRNIVRETVSEVLKESKYDYEPYFDEYNEFDRNNPLELEDCWELKKRYLDGDDSKEVFDGLICGIEEGDGDAYDAYEIAKRKGDWPEFVKAAENAMSWDKFDRDAVSAREKRKKLIRNAYYNDEPGGHPFADAPDENGNRFEFASNAVRRNNWRKTNPPVSRETWKKKPNGTHFALNVQNQNRSGDIARTFNGSRRSIMDKM